MKLKEATFSNFLTTVVIDWAQARKWVGPSAMLKTAKQHEYERKNFKMKLNSKHSSPNFKLELLELCLVAKILLTLADIKGLHVFPSQFTLQLEIIGPHCRLYNMNFLWAIKIWKCLEGFGHSRNE